MSDALPRGCLRLIDGDVQTVIDTAAVAFDVPVGDLVGSSRTPRLVAYRHVAMAAARRLGFSYPVIAKAFDRDHSTVIHACKSVADKPELAHRVGVLAEAVGNTSGRLL